MSAPAQTAKTRTGEEFEVSQDGEVFSLATYVAGQAKDANAERVRAFVVAVFRQVQGMIKDNPDAWRLFGTYIRDAVYTLTKDIDPKAFDALVKRAKMARSTGHHFNIEMGLYHGIIAACPNDADWWDVSQSVSDMVVEFGYLLDRDKVKATAALVFA
jgi:hypothetical protein